MKKHEKYLEALKEFDDFVTIKEWAEKFKEKYPDDIDDKNENEKIIIRKLVKNITSLVSTGKWSSMLLIDKSTKPQKIKYTTEEQKEDKTQNIHVTQSTKEVKSVNFKLLIKGLQLQTDDYDLPNRDQYTNFETNGHACGYREYIAFEMAIRNKEVINITQKLDHIKNIIENNQESLKDYSDWILGIKYWEDEFEGEPPEFTVDSELKKEYLFIAEMPTNKFIEEIDFLATEKDLLNKKPEAFVHLKIIADYLQDKLLKEYHIYKDGYFFIHKYGYFDPDEAVDSNSIYKHDFSVFNLPDEKKLIIEKFINRKDDNMKKTADMFFMWDYYIKRKADDNLVFYTQDIKFELTKYHGIKIEGFEEKLTYDDCLDRYEELKNLNASFYTVEKRISDKIQLMEEFIDKKLYKFILFY